VRSCVQRIDASAERLDRLVANLVDMSRIHAGMLVAEVQAVRLEEAVAAAVSAVGAEDRVIVDLPTDLPAIRTDAALIERALAHVIENAVTWSQPASPPRVEAAQVGNGVHLRVVDRGPGVPPADRERVFEPFQQLAAGNDGGGTGLGLAVARGFVQAGGGTIMLDDTPGGGLTVLIDLPVASLSDAPQRPSGIG
jgi:two-component system sensor histidine kinase KdpD